MHGRGLFADSEGRLDRALLFVFLIVNGLVLFNAVFHDPTVQYDGTGHLAYIAALAHLHLPTADESTEFFSAPLAYLLPAMAKAAGLSLWWAAKFGQMVNVALSLGITAVLIVLSRSLQGPSGRDTALIALMCLGTLPVYYKTMAFVRGEPYVAFLTLVAIAATARAVTSTKQSTKHSWAGTVLPGVCWGLLVLARQWGALAALALLAAVWMALLRDRSRRQVKVALAAPLVALAVGGWFYGLLWTAYGSPIAFNRPAAEAWSFSNEPRDFYTGTGNGRLFADPIRPSFPNQLIPIFYAETWGDYWGFFSIYGRDPQTKTYILGPAFEKAVGTVPPIVETNRFTLNRYLGRMNLVGLLPTALALIAFGAAAVRLPAFLRRASPVTAAEIIPVMAVLVVAVSALGYLWFVIRFPNPGKGDSIKATYMLQIFPPLALLIADFLRRFPVSRTGLVVVWGLLMTYDLPAVTTHFMNIPR